MTTLPQANEVPFPLALDNSTLSTFRTCERKALYQYKYHLRPFGANIHLLAGGTFAKALEVFRICFYGHNMTHEDALAHAIYEGMREWGEEDPLDDEPKSLWNTLFSVIAHFEEFPPATDYIKPHFIHGKPAVEFTFALPLDVDHPDHDQPLLYCGRFDMLAEFNNSIFVEDDKTSARLGGTWVHQWALSSQITGYVWAAQLFGHPVVGAIIRGTSIQTYDVKFAVSTQYREHFQIERWLTQTQRDATRLRTIWNKEEEVSFALGFECTNCPYRQLCQARDWRDWVEGNYEVKVWDPLEIIKYSPEHEKSLRASTPNHE